MGDKKLTKYDFWMAQVMQWPPAICNYIKKVRLDTIKYSST